LYKRGGGAIHIIAGNFINDGIITASGGVSASGGSILVEAFNLSGTGLFKANGGSYHTTTVIHAPGGGGRIALHGEYTVWNSKLEVLVVVSVMMEQIFLVLLPELLDFLMNIMEF
jgi:hypothetical protein